MVQTQNVTGAARFWSDDFDLDLPKVLPEVEAMFTDLAEVKLFTHGGETYGRLDHPTCWNTDKGLTAFVSLRANPRPDANFYYTPDPVRECTPWELARDAWAHSYVIALDGRSVWDGEANWRDFETILWVKRGWGGGSKNASLPSAKARAMKRLRALAASIRLAEMARLADGGEAVHGNSDRSNDIPPNPSPEESQ
jgi:hypothetical protein